MVDENQSLVINFFKFPTEEYFVEIWKLNSDMAMKCLFYILDQKNETEKFIDIFGNWVYKNHKSVFFKNLSLILGIYNEKILTDKQIKEITKKDYEYNEFKLKELLEEDYRESFRKEFISRARKTYFTTVYIIPVYGNVEIMRALQKLLKDDSKTNSKCLAYHTIEHLIRRYELSNKIINENKVTLNETFEKQYQFISGVGVDTLK
jgi:hypothetical protein